MVAVAAVEAAAVTVVAAVAAAALTGAGSSTLDPGVHTLALTLTRHAAIPLHTSLPLAHSRACCPVPGAVQYPLALIMHMPQSSSSAELKVMYSRPLPFLTTLFKVNKPFTLEDAADFDEEWLKEKLKL